MAFGIIEYDENGKPICEICKRSFKRVLSHVRQVHDMSEKEYKKLFGFDLFKGICSLESAEKSKIKTLLNYDRCIKANLIANGEQTRFVKGSKGRTKDKVQEQTKIMLKNRLTEAYMTKAMSESGKKVGKSGLGNLKRWGKNMELNDFQIEALRILKEELSISKYSTKVSISTMNKLHLKGLVRCPRYANGEFWELTDKGIEKLKKNEKNM